MNDLLWLQSIVWFMPWSEGEIDMKRSPYILFDYLISISLFLGFILPTYSSDWPMWRHDAGRSGATPDELPVELHLQWVRENPPLKPAWPDEPRMIFDEGYEPIAIGKTLIVGSSFNDSVTAYHTENGETLWQYFAEGPVRFAPIGWQDCVYFTSDAGHLYCLNAEDGTLNWKFQGAPSERKVIGNERLISTWPGRGGPVLADGTIYFTNGIWPFMGVFVYALDATTGELIWVNDRCDIPYTTQPHNSPAFSGISPQGYLAAYGNRLIVPNSRAVAAGFDRDSGEMLYCFSTNNETNGSSFIGGLDNSFANSGRLFNSENGVTRKLINLNRDSILSKISNGKATYKELRESESEPVFLNKVMYHDEPGAICAYDIGAQRVSQLWKFDIDAKVRLAAGHRLFAGAPQKLYALDLPADATGTPEISWQTVIEGTPRSAIAADGKLFVTTMEGTIYCFGGHSVQTIIHPYTPVPYNPPNDGWETKAAQILNTANVRDGYCVVLGAGSGRLIEEIVRQSNLYVIAFDPDAEKINELRREYDRAGLYGARISLSTGTISTSSLPPYLAHLITSEDIQGSGLLTNPSALSELFQVLRPYGGTACLTIPADWDTQFSSWIHHAEYPNAEVDRTNGMTLIKREGALPGSDDWTHQYADAANTVVSHDRLVKAPLGILWFGGPSNAKILPGHGHGPSQQVVGGGLFIEGPDTIRALDVYTGRLLWERFLPDIGKAYNNTTHQPGAIGLGSNYVSTSDGIYVAYGTSCFRLDPITGEILSEFTYSTGDGNQAWGFLAVWNDYLIAGVEPNVYNAAIELGRPNNWNWTSSKHLIALNRYTGQQYWQRDAIYGFYNNTIAIANGTVFCIDRLPITMVNLNKRRGKTAAAITTLQAIDIHSGESRWSTTENIFGTWLGYSEEYDILIEAGRPSTDSLNEASKHIVARRGKDGTVVWDQSFAYGGPCMIHGDTLITQGAAYELLTGNTKMHQHPLTGELLPWTFKRNYGCDTAVASEYLLTFRSAAAGFYDLANNGGTGNLGGFKSGCTSNLIVANGVLSAPDYTRTCICSYQNQTSLALIHTPNAEMWTFNTLPGAGTNPIERVGINLGAPGDRVAENGTLWLDYPRGMSPSPDVTISVEPSTSSWYRRHSSTMVDDELGWIGASGVEGVQSIRVALASDASTPTTYRVRLYFAEPNENTLIGERAFTVSIQETPVLVNWDIRKEAGIARKTIVKEFRNIEIQNELTVAFHPSAYATVHLPIISGIEIIDENASTPIANWGWY